MGRLKQKGKAGAAKAYITRTAAVKKLQCSLADFRRLCILKGIFPREPRHKKRANKGSSAPTSFYYAKDIAYLQHEPILKKLREHKAFAKKLSRALGRGEWSNAKSLEANKPTYRLDHIIKERYPTFIDALRDIDDALCLVTLFASLPSNDRVPSSLIQNCTKLANEWQLYVMNTYSLRKVFLSIKGVYYQAEVQGEKITWLVPYQFTQSIPSDVDVRVMLTFLELYQTLLGFVFFKLYMDEGWVYPPPMDLSKDEAGAGVGAFSLQNTKNSQPILNGKAINESQVSNKTVKQTIKELTASITTSDVTSNNPSASVDMTDEDEDFVPQSSKADPNAATTTLPTLKSITESASTSSIASKLFAPYSFYLSRETPRPLMEFVIRAFGGRVGWPSSSGSGSPYGEDDDSITHVIIDRPIIPGQTISVINALPHDGKEESEEEWARRRRRKYVQPQWVMDCINAGRILPEERYVRGAELPPHLSPFGEEKGAYEPSVDHDTRVAIEDVDMTEEESELEGEEDEDEEMDQGDEDEDEEEKHTKQVENAKVRALQKAKNVAKTQDSAAVRAAELEAEAAGIDFGTFNKATKAKPNNFAKVDDTKQKEEEMNKMMMTNKQRKLYEKMKYGERKRNEEKALLEQKRAAIDKAKKKEIRKKAKEGRS